MHVIAREHVVKRYGTYNSLSFVSPRKAQEKRLFTSTEKWVPPWDMVLEEEIVTRILGGTVISPSTRKR